VLPSGYRHLYFSTTTLQAALEGLDQAVQACGWTPVGVGAAALRPFHQRWRHRRLPVELSSVVIGFYPPAVTIGGELHGTGPLGGWLVRRTLRRLQRRAGGIGATPLADEGLFQFRATADQRWRRAVDVELEVQQCAFLMGHRRCPSCAEWCAAADRWCWSCEYEFTGEDDHRRDATSVAARQRVDWLRQQGLDGPAVPPPALPPLSSLLGFADGPGRGGGS
jgi:hypothetical protein